MFQIGIITAPRKDPTLNSTIKSLRKVGYNENLFIYSEPQEINPIEGCEIFVNQSKLGCFKNFDRALRHLIEHSPHQFICVFSDDFKFSSRFMTFIRYSGDGYYALYTPKGMRYTRKIRTGWNKINEGWAGTYGGNYMMSKEIARKIIEHPMYIDHYENYEKNEQIDHIIPKVCFDVGINQYFHNPSPTDHIGLESTIGHVHSTHEQGLNFIK